jgi:hypothetical protein
LLTNGANASYQQAAKDIEYFTRMRSRNELPFFATQSNKWYRGEAASYSVKKWQVYKVNGKPVSDHYSISIDLIF